MDQPDELSDMTTPELDYIIARARTLDKETLGSELTYNQALVLLASVIDCGFQIVRGPVLSGRPN